MAQNKQNLMKEISQIIIDISSRQRKDFREENMILELCCNSPDAYPRVIAEQYNKLVKGAYKTGDDVIHVFRLCRLDRFRERVELLNQANRNARQILDAASTCDASVIPDIRRQLDRHFQSPRLTFLALITACKSELSDDAYSYSLRMNRDFSGECLDTILDAIEANVSGVPASASGTGLTPEEYEREIYNLTAALNRSNNLIARLQDSYEEQIIEIRVDESVRMISMLNSEKYGYILDLLVSAQEGFRQLKKKGAVPFEIKSLQSLSRRLMEFVEDCGIEPMLEIGEQLTVTASDLTGFSYDGAPFVGSDDQKRVEVISPGWSVPEKEIVISYPRVKEITEEN